MEYELVDTQVKPHRFRFKDVAPDQNGIHEKSQGGTEQLYRFLSSNLKKETLDKFQIICSRVREGNLIPNKKKILWLHDTWDDPESQHLSDEQSRKRFDQLVFVSNYQFTTYNVGLGVPYEKSIVIKNAINPIQPTGYVQKPLVENGNFRLIYHTTPHRGLELLVPTFIELLKFHPNMTLDVFSSFKIYGWEERDQQYKSLLDTCKNHPNINYHGFQPNSVVRDYLKRAHIFSFPSIWPETSCLAAIEAMSAGCVVVASDFAALPETIGDHGFMYRWTENKNNNINRFATLLKKILDNWESPIIANTTKRAQDYVRVNHNWDTKLGEWENILSILAR